MSQKKKMKRIAVLIDAENVKASSGLQKLLRRLKKTGKKTTIRAYGDWTNNCMSKWKSVLDAFGICSVQQRNLVSGKNLADMKLIIDAMDMIHTCRYDTFVIVTSDSDFIPLYQRMQEAGKTVIIVGDKVNVSPAIIEYGDFYIDLAKGSCISVKPVENRQIKKLTRNLCGDSQKQKAPVETGSKMNGENVQNAASTADSNKSDSKNKRSKLRKEIRTICQQAPTKTDGGFVTASYIGTHLSKQMRAIYKELGYKKLRDYLQSDLNHYEIKKDNGGDWRVLVK